MSDTDEQGETAFRLLKVWVTTNTDQLAKGVLPDSENGANAFTALGVVLEHVEQFMSVDRRRVMALAVDKALGGHV